MSRKLRAGDWVRVREKYEILRTLDAGGCLDGLPFMPEMFEYCGKRLRVFKRAHKTCDTIDKTGGRSMSDAVHLEGARCTGQAHGGCQAACMIFWKTAWLTEIDESDIGRAPVAALSPEESGTCDGMGCSEENVIDAARVPNSDDADITYSCQATRLLEATHPLSRWNPSQYWEDFWSGNASFATILRGALFAFYERLINLGIGWGSALRWCYNRFQKLRGGIPYPRPRGKCPTGTRTPSANLDLEVGEIVRVKPLHEIVETLDANNRNRGLYFDAEEVPFCGGAYRVLERVERIINEKTGKMMEFKNPSVILDGAYCQARYSCKRMFCPRAIYPMWREVWLERVEAKVPEIETHSSSRPASSIQARIESAS
jgi:hypothetical protein